ncbi:hypothetical protein P7I20_08380 [Enterococcus casseliflavus]|uniref:hypothetical protein n=1 Tax=Enterococcus casseliflavus TaxID=37734 RepID=UPI000EB3993E|nr:hypothetical protein [Enterococcus casseliflavus]AYJ46083.1 hypothetical protein D8N35_13705 [Enterococcus casseliflavus]MBS5814982.1 hypothetical protein [Enterococcus casseliflavus]MCD4962337.1 hypothetical protein [Enterococcus casseliflavus]MDT2973792.1 hypothetical protein [Enterococcus casseliflavus]MDT2979383.1 hypothetical protein [Enterococcus casseliflavus]
MKKVILGTTLATSLLLAGGVNAFANTIPTITKPIEIEVIDGVATFQFNELMPEETSSVEITSDILEENGGKVSGAIPNVGGTLQNLTSAAKTVNIVTTAPENTISITENALIPVEALAYSAANESKEVTFTIDRVSAIAYDDENRPVITITAQDATDTGETPPL